MLIFGIILLGLSLSTINTNIRNLELKYRPHDKRIGDKPTDRPARRMLRILLYLTILTLIFLPLLPYFGLTIENEIDVDKKVEITDFTYGSPFWIEGMSGSGSSSYSNIQDDFSGLGILAWLFLIFLVIGFIGLAIYSMNRGRLVYISLFLTAAIAFVILAALMIAYHGFMIKDIFELADELSGSSSYKGVIYAYNYMPLIFSIIILIFSIFFLIFVIKYSRPVFAEIMSRRAYGYGYGYGPGYQPYPPPPPMGPGSPPGRATPVEPYHDSKSPARGGPRPTSGPTPGQEPPYQPRGYPPPQRSREGDYGGRSTIDKSYYGEPAKACPTCGARVETSPHGDYCTGCGRYL
jgi:hypothetical protein